MPDTEIITTGSCPQIISITASQIKTMWLYQPFGNSDRNSILILIFIILPVTNTVLRKDLLKVCPFRCSPHLLSSA